MHSNQQISSTSSNNQQIQSFPSSRNKNLLSYRHRNNINFPYKTNTIYSTYSRLIPKKPIHDIERLYSENIQLKQKIKFLQESHVKIKTRASLIERQKQQAVAWMARSNVVGKNMYSMEKKMEKINGNGKRNRIVSTEHRKILHEYKDEVEKVKLENTRLKKTLKYTKIQQIQIQNQHLHKQLSKAKDQLQNILADNSHDQCERSFQNISKQLQREKDITSSLHFQLKKKDYNLQQMKTKMKLLLYRKSDLQKKYARQLSRNKEQLVKVKNRQLELSLQNKNKLSDTNCRNINQTTCFQCQNNKNKDHNQKYRNSDLQHKLNNKEKQIIQLHKKFPEQDKHPQQQQPHIFNHSTTNNYQKNPTIIDTPKNKPHLLHNKINNEKQNQEINEDNSKNNCKELFTVHQKKNNNQDSLSANLEQTEYDNQRFQCFESVADSAINQKKDNCSVKLQIISKDRYQQSANGYKSQKVEEEEEQQEEEQVIYQKQDKPKKRKSSQKSKHKEKPQEISLAKQYKILKETIKYRLIAQRYPFSNFHRDILKSKIIQFTVQQLIQMFSNQPFFLSQQHLKLIICSLFEKQALQPEDKITTDVFLTRMNNFTPDIELISQEQEEQIMQSIQEKLSNQKFPILSRMQYQAHNSSISKKRFMRILQKIGGLTTSQIEQCLAEVSVMSVDISKINYLDFVQGIVRQK